MIKAESYKGQHIAIVGLGRSGISVARSLKAGGAHVYAWDDNEAVRQSAKDEGVPIVDLKVSDWDIFHALVLSPSIAHTFPKPHWSAARANEANVPIICDIEVFATEIASRAPERRPKVIAITGTNGKFTTTSLIGHILTTCGRDAQIGGNIGREVLDLDPMHSGMVYVLELSSYQLERINSLRADVAVFLNLTPDHIERHGDMKAYEAAKFRIFNNQQKGDAAVVGVDNAEGKRICTRLMSGKGRKVSPISGRKSLGKGVCVVNGKLYDALSLKCVEVSNLSSLTALEGHHNWQNTAAAYAAIAHFGLTSKAIAKAISTFKGLAHRMETIGSVGPVRYINDSKATNVDACAQALKSYDNIYWIAGGQPKDGGINALTAELKNVTQSYMIGEAAPEFAKTAEPHCPAQICADLRQAVLSATQDALASGKPNPVILLSPACASFDQFENFETRGEAFSLHVNAIISMYEREKINKYVLENGAAA